MRYIFENGNSNNDKKKNTYNSKYILWMNSILRRSKEIGKVEHPLGLIDCMIVLNKNFKNNLVSKKDLIKSCGIYRTSRILMKGQVYF